MINNINDISSIQNAADLIDQGEIIIYPTDTMYGFGVDATNHQAIQCLNLLKNREQPYSIIVSSFEMLKKYSAPSNDQLKILKNILPGPFTIILNKIESNLSKLISLNLNTIGIRIPKHQFPLNLTKLLNRPIVTTSVNFHNNIPLLSFKSIKDAFFEINIFKDKNISRSTKGSTIIDFTQNPNKILRQGDGKFIL